MAGITSKPSDKAIDKTADHLERPVATARDLISGSLVASAASCRASDCFLIASRLASLFILLLSYSGGARSRHPLGHHWSWSVTAFFDFQIVGD
jgi:hypothetical protein